MENCIWKRFFAEMLGTFVLVFFACGTAVVTNADPVATSLSFGLVIVAMAYSIGQISGCHINPAVSLGMLIAKRMNVKEFFIYIAAQFLGAIIGAALLYGILEMADISIAVWATNGALSTTAGGYIASFILEIVLTFVFVYTIIAVTSKKTYAKKAGLIIGLTLTLVHLIGVNLTGTSVNPARSFGTAAMAAAFGAGTVALEQIWIFLLAPLAGGALAAIVFALLHGKDADENII